MSKRSGHAVVELALAFPLFCLLALASFDLTFLFVQQCALERTCADLARKVALTGDSPSLLLGPRSPIQATLTIHHLPSTPSSHPFRAPKNVDIVELTLERKVKPLFPLMRVFTVDGGFRLRSRVCEVKT